MVSSPFANKRFINGQSCFAALLGFKSFDSKVFGNQNIVISSVTGSPPERSIVSAEDALVCMVPKEASSGCHSLNV